MDKVINTEDNKPLPYSSNIEKVMQEWLHEHNFQFNRYICCSLLRQVLKKITIQVEEKVLISLINVIMPCVLPSVFNYFEEHLVEDVVDAADAANAVNDKIPPSLYNDYIICKNTLK